MAGTADRRKRGSLDGKSCRRAAGGLVAMRGRRDKGGFGTGRLIPRAVSKPATSRSAP
jgi:hypothetical protein